jgi:hypothetical protein
LEVRTRSSIPAWCVKPAKNLALIGHSYPARRAVSKVIGLLNPVRTNSRNTFTQQQFSLARHCQQALLRKLPYALVSPRGLIRELRPHPGHIEEMRP